ncbi:hypothetical protein PHYSODRAFT_565814 [Phytophthora sojae]|uniref:Uncharacterized protein n=1 Tax=Phytophthora sojae (strain P6497) TaxID=1094619 RepID=G5AC69_PHYSP|nr:hypothetical protein PHYSODRAFT_565814 [Phytophthora sojae]EGZ06943.1 hypothetical protein PHYSODRAFT_565814 [Phytophthora sojae]|eukprot:XP_009537707.1 hypothetical protein PHYSODRAFT_565814 [Phytophthora sojae]
MPSAAKKPLRQLPFQDAHAVKYALRVSRRSIVDGVREVECRMCRAFGPEEDDDAAVGSKRKLQPDVKSWAGPLFRTDYFMRHLKAQHEVHWAIYQTLESEEEKDKYLREEEDEEVPFNDEEKVVSFDETDAGQESFAAALERETQSGREKLLATISEIMANQRKSAEALQTMMAGIQADYVSLRQRELEIRERELKCLEAERRERQEDRKVNREFLALLKAKQAD